MKPTRDIEPLRRDIEFLIRSSCLPELGGTSKWSRVDFPVEIAFRQCQAESGFNVLARRPISTGDPRRPTEDAFGLFGLTERDSKELKLNHLDWRQNAYGGIKKDKVLFVRYSGDIAKVAVAFRWGQQKVDDAVLARPSGDKWKLLVPPDVVQYVIPILKP